MNLCNQINEALNESDQWLSMYIETPEEIEKVKEIYSELKPDDDGGEFKEVNKKDTKGLVTMICQSTGDVKHMIDKITDAKINYSMK